MSERLTEMPIVTWELQPASSLSAGDEIILTRRNGFKGERWTIWQRGWVLNKSAEWEYEPIPSSRTEEWLETVRWNSAEEAFQAWRERDGQQATTKEGRDEV